MIELWNRQRRETAVAVANQWRGTPHRNRIAQMGRGIDCIRFVVRILEAAGVVEQKPLPSYPLAWGLCAPENKLAPLLATALDCKRLPADEWVPEFGDVVIWRVGYQSNHCGIVLDGKLWHVATGEAVGPTSIDRARNEIQEAVRISSIGWKIEPAAVNLRFL